MQVRRHAVLKHGGFGNRAKLFPGNHGLFELQPAFRGNAEIARYQLIAVGQGYARAEKIIVVYLAYHAVNRRKNARPDLGGVIQPFMEAIIGKGLVEAVAKAAAECAVYRREHLQESRFCRQSRVADPRLWCIIVNLVISGIVGIG